MQEAAELLSLQQRQKDSETYLAAVAGRAAIGAAAANLRKRCNQCEACLTSQVSCPCLPTRKVLVAVNGESLHRHISPRGNVKRSATHVKPVSPHSSAAPVWLPEKVPCCCAVRGVRRVAAKGNTLAMELWCEASHYWDACGHFIGHLPLFGCQKTPHAVVLLRRVAALGLLCEAPVCLPESMAAKAAATTLQLCRSPSSDLMSNHASLSAIASCYGDAPLTGCTKSACLKQCI